MSEYSETVRELMTIHRDALKTGDAEAIEAAKTNLEEYFIYPKEVPELHEKSKLKRALAEVEIE